MTGVCLAFIQKTGKGAYIEIEMLSASINLQLTRMAEFFATGLADMRARLQNHDIAFRERTVPSLGIHQVFFEDPSGVTLELNYPAAETAAA